MGPDETDPPHVGAREVDGCCRTHRVEPGPEAQDRVIHHAQQMIQQGAQMLQHMTGTPEQVQQVTHRVAQTLVGNQSCTPS